MNLLKRWSLSLSTSFEEIMNKIENHEALVNGTIAEMKEASARAQAKMKRITSDGEKMKARIKELKEQIPLWEERARRVANSERERALLCLERKEQCKRELTALETQQKEHEELSRQLQRDFHALSGKIAELTRKKNIMAARELRAQASQLPQPGQLLDIGEVDEIFERWELKIHRCDALSAPTDELSEAFLSEERRAELESQLDELTSEKKE